MNKSTIAYKIEIDHTAETVTLKESGRKGFIEKSYQITPAIVAETCRSAAYELLERAHFLDHQSDFFAPDFNLTEQIDKMTDEHRPLFSSQAAV